MTVGREACDEEKKLGFLPEGIFTEAEGTGQTGADVDSIAIGLGSHLRSQTAQ